MQKEAILIVEDESEWATDYKRWLGDQYLIEDASNASQALDKLRKKYYSLVLLDLSLHPGYDKDRSSEEVQNYLKDNPEGTKHIIISSQADKYDVRKGTIQYKAFEVLFKDDLENISPFLESVKNAIDASQKERPNFVKEAYALFCGNTDYGVFEYKLLELLQPHDGFPGWFYFKEDFFKAIAPIRKHLTRSNIVFKDNCLLGLYWSRQLGHAISICLANRDVKEEECLNAVNSWLGWDHSKDNKLVANSIQGYYFIENDLSHSDFEM